MTESAFVVVGARQAPPWRPRRTFRDYLPFSAEASTVLICESLATGLRRLAEYALPRETGGLLAGRIFRDQEGVYTVIFDVAQAGADSAGVGHIRLAPETTSALREQLAVAAPACDVVGWWHSHPGRMGFSATDLSNQRIWTDPNHVGLLVYARGPDWGCAYLGPDARLLTPTWRPSLKVRDPARPAHRSPSNGDPRPEIRVGRRIWSRRVVFVLGICALATLVLLQVLTLHRIGKSDSSSAPRTYAWSCVAYSAKSYDCAVAGAATAAPDGLGWLIDGQTIRQGPSLTVRTTDRPVTITLFLRRVDGSRQMLGSQVLPALTTWATTAPSALPSLATSPPVGTTVAAPTDSLPPTTSSPTR